MFSYVPNGLSAKSAKKLSIINSQFSTINYPGLRAAERPTNRAEVYAEPVEVKTNHAETKFNRVETKSNRVEVKSNRVGTNLPLAIKFYFYAKKINLQGNNPCNFPCKVCKVCKVCKISDLITY